jgi:peptide/nickel transport system substrate-binding protein
MKLSALLLLAAASLSVAATAWASTRPHYGGTLRVAVEDAPASLDPSDSGQPDSLAWRSLSTLIFDTLVILNARAEPHAALASSWQAQPGNQRWQFNVRHGVAFHDGSAVTPAAVAASLRSANPNWKVIAAEEAVVIECKAPTPNLLAILAQPHYGIAKRDGGKLTGTGAFAITRWEPGKKLTLTARDDYWGGRAFVDAIEIELGKSLREQMISLDLGRADLAEVAPDQARHAAAENRRVGSSAPGEWMALEFSREPQSADEGKLRQALGLSIDRASMNVLLQGAGEPAGSVLPNWLSGYAFLFSVAMDLQKARQLRSEVQQVPSWALEYDGSDPLARVITERIALNARDAGLTVQPTNSVTNSAAADVRLVRIPLPSPDARVALGGFAARLGLPQPRFESDSPASVYAAENALLQSHRVIPLLHLRSTVALGSRVSNWAEDPDGKWQLQNLWLGTEKP